MRVSRRLAVYSDVWLDTQLQCCSTLCQRMLSSACNCLVIHVFKHAFNPLIKHAFGHTYGHVFQSWHKQLLELVREYVVTHDFTHVKTVNRVHGIQHNATSGIAPYTQRYLHPTLYDASNHDRPTTTTHRTPAVRTRAISPLEAPLRVVAWLCVCVWLVVCVCVYVFGRSRDCEWFCVSHHQIYIYTYTCVNQREYRR